MQQQQIIEKPSAYPRRRDVFLHFVKTGRLVGSLFTDPRVPVIRKILFVVVVAALAAILVFPDTLGELGLSVVLPVIGTVLGIPIDAGFDWTAFALLSVNLLRIFPSQVVSEHYGSLFHR